MRKRYSILIALTILLTLIPGAVFADEGGYTPPEFVDVTQIEEPTEETPASILEENQRLMAKIPVDKITLGPRVSGGVYRNDNQFAGSMTYINYVKDPELEAMTPEIKERMKTMVGSGGNKSDYEMLKSIARWTNMYVEYTYGYGAGSYYDSAYQAILYPEYRYGNCMRFTQIIQTMLWLEGIPNVRLLVGDADDDRPIHEVGAAYVDGEWYYFDGTALDGGVRKDRPSMAKIFEIYFSDTDDHAYTIRREDGLIAMSGFEKDWGEYKVTDVTIPSFVEVVYDDMKHLLSNPRLTSVKAETSTYGASVIEELSAECKPYVKDGYIYARLDHEYGDYVVIKEPTCREAGTVEATCKYCGKKKQRDFAKIDHNYVLTDEKDATCTEDGYKKYKCTMCDLTKEETFSKTGHDPGELIEEVPSTCTEEGTGAHYICQNCGKYLSPINPDNVVESLVIPKKEHVYDQEVVDEKYLAYPASEYIAAHYYKSCICGAKGTETFEYGKPLDPVVHVHDYTWKYDENFHWQVCDCGEISGRASHNFEKVNGENVCTDCGLREADCHKHRFNYSNYGYDAEKHWRKCIIAGCDYTEEPEAHTWRNGKCTVCGAAEEHTHSYSEEWTSDDTNHWHKCTGCNETSDLSEHVWIDDGNAIACAVCGKVKHEHSYSGWSYDEASHWSKCDGCDKTSDYGLHEWIQDRNDFICSVCGATKKGVDPEHQHSYSSWSGNDEYHWKKCTGCDETSSLEPHNWITRVKTDATCEDDGAASYKCSVCGKIKNEITPAYGHTWEETIEEPTCEGAGLRTLKCTTCGETRNEVIPATGHKWSKTYTVDQEPTCSEEGSESLHCEICGASGKTRAIPKKDHIFIAWETKKAATELAEGIKESTCPVCGETVSETIPQLAPTLPAVTISKVTAAKKAATVKWKKVSAKNQKKIAKIQIQYSTDKNFKTGVKSVYVKKSAVSRKITKLTSKKKYYFRIRAYKKSGGVTHVSKWSKVKYVKVK